MEGYTGQNLSIPGHKFAPFIFYSVVIINSARAHTQCDCIRLFLSETLRTTYHLPILPAKLPSRQLGPTQP